MHRPLRLLSCAVALLLVSASATVADAQVTITQASVDQLTANWPVKPREVATTTIAKYGLPDEATASMLIWHNNGSWKRTILYREEVAHDFPKPHTDLLEQFVNFRVPTNKFDELAAYDGSVIVERTKGEISARCDKEEMNFLALNLANDIVSGRRTVAQARKFYADTAMAAMRGETPPYVQGLRFSTDLTRTADRDLPFVPGTMVSGFSEQETRTRLPKE
jgi:hypothetical protein